MEIKYFIIGVIGMLLLIPTASAQWEYFLPPSDDEFDLVRFLFTTPFLQDWLEAITFNVLTVDNLTVTNNLTVENLTYTQKFIADDYSEINITESQITDLDDYWTGQVDTNYIPKSLSSILEIFVESALISHADRVQSLLPLDLTTGSNITEVEHILFEDNSVSFSSSCGFESGNENDAICLALGANPSIVRTGNICGGAAFECLGEGNVVGFGQQINYSEPNCNGMGAQSDCHAQFCTTIGFNATCTENGLNGICIGTDAQCDAQDCVAIGNGVSCNVPGEVVIGGGGFLCAETGWDVGICADTYARINDDDGTFDVLKGMNVTTINGSVANFTTYVNLPLDSITYNASSIQNISGTVDSGNLSSILSARDEVLYNISENTGANPLTIIINFTGIEDFNSILMREWYQGGLGHEIEIGLLDCSGGGYEEEYGDITDMSDFAFTLRDVFDPSIHICAGDNNVSLQLRHDQNGVPSHDLILDYVVLIDGFNVITTTSHQSLSDRDDNESHPQYVLETGDLMTGTLNNFQSGTNPIFLFFNNNDSTEGGNFSMRMSDPADLNGQATVYIDGTRLLGFATTGTRAYERLEIASGKSLSMIEDPNQQIQFQQGQWLGIASDSRIRFTTDKLALGNTWDTANITDTSIMHNNSVQAPRIIKQQSFFHAYDHNGGTALGMNSWVNITWDTEIREDQLYTHGADSQVIQIDEDGWYEINFDCSTNSTSAATRAESMFRMINKSTELPGTRGHIYNRQASQGHGSASINIIRHFASGTELVLQGQHDNTLGGGVLTVADSCRIILERI